VVCLTAATNLVLSVSQNHFVFCCANDYPLFLEQFSPHPLLGKLAWYASYSPYCPHSPLRRPMIHVSVALLPTRFPPLPTPFPPRMITVFVLVLVLTVALSRTEPHGAHSQ
jgi:hypothetical protein